MRIRRMGLTLLAGIALVAAACTTGSSSSPSASATPDPCAAFTPGKGHTLPTDKTKIKIGVVTDVGTVNDKNFNEYTYNGAVDGAAAIGTDKPPVTVPKDPSEYAKDLQAYIDQGFDIIVTAGFNLGTATGCAALANPGVWFIGVDQAPVTGADHYVALGYQEDQAGYLAGIIAASVSKTGVLGAIGGITLCGPCIKYIQGFQLGAQSINPNVKIKIGWVTTSDFVKAFNDPVTGKSFGKQFLDQNKDVDVLFQVAGKTGNGVLDAACDAGIYGVGVDVDQALSYPNAAKCTITSAEKKLSKSVASVIGSIAGGTMKGGADLWNAARDGVGYSPAHDLASVVPATATTAADSAFQQMKATPPLKTCPDKCGDLATLQASTGSGSPAPSGS